MLCVLVQCTMKLPHQTTCTKRVFESLNRKHARIWWRNWLHNRFKPCTQVGQNSNYYNNLRFFQMKNGKEKKPMVNNLLQIVYLWVMCGSFLKLLIFRCFIEGKLFFLTCVFSQPTKYTIENRISSWNETCVWSIIYVWSFVKCEGISVSDFWRFVLSKQHERVQQIPFRTHSSFISMYLTPLTFTHNER